MPSPVGHALAGVAAGYLLGGTDSGRLTEGQSSTLSARNLLSDRRVITFAMLGVLPDVDFLFGVHSAYTHSVGAIVVVGLMGGFVGARAGLAAGVAAAAAYGSHVALDWLGSDAVAPIGVMALWPLSSDFFLSDRQWFMSVCREYWLAECWWHNSGGLIRELLMLGPVALGAVVMRRRLSRR